MRSATRAAPVTSASSRSTANSSPPSREAVSSLRRLDRTRCAVSTRTWSPAAWPRLSLIVLKLSRSMNSTAVFVAFRRSRACSTRSRKRLRLASLVSGSWNAWKVSFCSRALRSRRSRVFRTTPVVSKSPLPLLATVSTGIHVPSGWRMRHSPLTRLPGDSIARSTRERSCPTSSGWARSVRGVFRSS